MGGRAKQARGAVAPSWRRVRRDVTVFTWSVSGDSLAGHYANDPRSRSTPGKSQVLLRGSRVGATRSHRGLRPPAGKVEGGSNDWTWAVRVTLPLDVMTLDFRVMVFGEVRKYRVARFIVSFLRGCVLPRSFRLHSVPPPYEPNPVLKLVERFQHVG